MIKTAATHNCRTCKKQRRRAPKTAQNGAGRTSKKHLESTCRASKSSRRLPEKVKEEKEVKAILKS